MTVLYMQNASADVEKMILGNKCDLQESRVVDQERGRVVSSQNLEEVGTAVCHSTSGCVGMCKMSQEFSHVGVVLIRG